MVLNLYGFIGIRQECTLVLWMPFLLSGLQEAFIFCKSQNLLSLAGQVRRLLADRTRFSSHFFLNLRRNHLYNDLHKQYKRAIFLPYIYILYHKEKADFSYLKNKDVEEKR